MSTNTIPAGKAALVNTVVVAGGYFLSRVLGIIRDIIINAQFGTTWQIGAYQGAFQIVDFLYLVIMGGALGSAFIPVFNGFLHEEHKAEAWRFANAVLSVALVLMIVCAALVAWQASFLIRLIFRDFSPQAHALAVDVLRLLLIQPVLLGVGGLAKAALESFDRFSVPALGSNLYNVGIILGALILAPFLGVFGLVWGVILGALLFLAVQLPALTQLGYRFATNFNLRTPGLQRVGWLMAPRVFGQSAWQLGLTISAGIASSFSDGAVRANGIALQLMMLPHGLLALSLGTVIFPRLSRAHAAGDHVAVRRESLGAIRNVIFLTLPAAITLGVLAVPVVRLLFERFRFTAESTSLTAEALRNYAIGLVAFAAAEIIVRTYYAMQDTATPVVAGVFTVALNVLLASTFVQQGAGIGGIGRAFSIASVSEASVLLLILWWRWRTLEGFWSALGRMLLAATVFGTALFGWAWVSAAWLPSILPAERYQWPWSFVPLALWTSTAVGVCGVLYLGLATLLRLPEAATFVSRIRKIIKR